jgi:DNA invertase Pin-like site-specific DNA recombinase
VLTPGDALTVWTPNRLSRSLLDLLLTLEAIAAAGVGFRSLTDATNIWVRPAF